jgi:hypothetical protein
MQDKQDTEASTDEVQYRKTHTHTQNPGGAVFRTGSVAASSTIGIGSFPGVKRPERGVSAEVKERVELHFYSPSGLSWPL